ncbi:hypothetical protein [Paenibacillus terrigena]|uniref:hypothetical protein n=1 Tax=Paenibacillus terrigena TaxID=369333 RepID=UPI00036E43AB|nr:hypothetical protein [Paenibacillus terrigena]
MYYYPYPGYYQRPTPSTDPANVDQFKYSAQQFLVPAAEMTHLLHTIAYNPGYAQQMKEAASKNNEETIRELIKAAGVKTPHSVYFTPDGIFITIKPKDNSACFAIRLSLCW